MYNIFDHSNLYIDKYFVVVDVLVIELLVFVDPFLFGLFVDHELFDNLVLLVVAVEHLIVVVVVVVVVDNLVVDTVDNLIVDVVDNLLVDVVEILIAVVVDVVVYWRRLLDIDLIQINILVQVILHIHFVVVD
jgi:hypothetical protein